MARAFTSVSVRAHAPMAPGVYGISNAREWIFIGQAQNIQARLIDHIIENDPELMSRQPTGFVFELCGTSTQVTRRDRLVVEYAPVCNTRRRS